MDPLSHPRRHATTWALVGVAAAGLVFFVVALLLGGNPPTATPECDTFRQALRARATTAPGGRVSSAPDGDLARLERACADSH